MASDVRARYMSAVVRVRLFSSAWSISCPSMSALLGEESVLKEWAAGRSMGWCGLGMDHAVMGTTVYSVRWAGAVWMNVGRWARARAASSVDIPKGWCMVFAISFPSLSL